MSEKPEQDQEQRGLGRVVYSHDSAAAQAERRDTTDPTDQIEEASEDSFPASDPPVYTTGQAESVAIEPGAQAETEHLPATADQSSQDTG